MHQQSGLRGEVACGRGWLFLNHERNYAFRSYEKWSTFFIRKELSVSFLYCQRLPFANSMRVWTWDSLLEGEKKRQVCFGILKSQWEVGRSNWKEKMLGKSQVNMASNVRWSRMWPTRSDLLRRKQGEMAKVALSKFLSQPVSKQWVLFFPLVRKFKYALDSNPLILSLKFF